MRVTRAHLAAFCGASHAVGLVLHAWRPIQYPTAHNPCAGDVCLDSGLPAASSRRPRVHARLEFDSHDARTRNAFATVTAAAASHRPETPSSIGGCRSTSVLQSEAPKRRSSRRAEWVGSSQSARASCARSNMRERQCVVPGRALANHASDRDHAARAMPVSGRTSRGCTSSCWCFGDAHAGEANLRTRCYRHRRRVGDSVLMPGGSARTAVSKRRSNGLARARACATGGVHDPSYVLLRALVRQRLHRGVRAVRAVAS